jgi:hypothetical protein
MVDKPNSARASEERHKPRDLQISGSLLSDEALRVIIDEWLIPAMLDDFVRTKILRREVEEGHNGEPLP